MPTSPMQRTLKACREMGRTCCIAEHWNPAAQRRQDLFGFIDLVALDGETIIAIQATTHDHHSHRRTKILTDRADAARLWLAGGGAIEIWSWKPQKQKSDNPNPLRHRWTARIEEITPEDFGQC